MKKTFVSIALLLAACAAPAQTTTVEWWLRPVGGPDIASYTTQANCDTAAKARAGAAGAVITYECPRRLRVVIPCGAKPANDVQTAQCPAGTVGSWSQVRSYVTAPAPTCWTPGTWTPSTAPAGACVTIPPKPADETQTVQCVAPLVGSWTQTRTYTLSGTTWTPGPWTPSAAPAGACTSPPSAQTWTLIGPEDDAVPLTVPDNSTVRYGKGTIWVQKTVSGSFLCWNGFFGSDPLPNVAKQCELLTSGTSTPPPTTVGSATLSWTAPTLNADGTPLTDLTGYRVLYGPQSGNYTQSLGAAASPVTVPNLTTGSWFFVVKAVDALGLESAASAEVSKTIN